MNYFKTPLLAFLLTLLALANCSAQLQVGLKTVEIQGEKDIDQAAIEALAYRVLNAAKDEERLNANADLKRLLKIELSKKSAFSFAFDSVKSMSIHTSPDSVFRLFNWNIPFNDGTFEYECGILKQEAKTGATAFYFFAPLNDSQKIEHLITNDKQWIPGLFYTLIQKTTDLQAYYTLLTWVGNDRLTSKKRIDVLWFDQSGAARFGAPIFVKGNSKLMRVSYEFSAQNTMELSYNLKNDRILLDHLSPSSSSLKGIYEYYGPDLSYDAYYWEKDKWIYHADVDADEGMKKSKKDFKLKEDAILEEKDIYSPN